MQIVNVVATASLNQGLDFNELKVLKEIFYDANIYQGHVAYFKTRHMTGRVSLFRSGKMISVGTKNEHDAFFELETAKKLLVRKGFVKSTILNPRVRNLIVSGDLEKSLNLEELAEIPKTIYEPEQFPALILHLKEPQKTTILVFSSGKIVITGLTSSKQIEPTVERLQKILGFSN
jgi:transcription initiation factor TFIID TATA-box-binding protein